MSRRSVRREKGPLDLFRNPSHPIFRVSDIIEKGVPEEEAIKRQGSVDEIAKEILLNTNRSNLHLRDWKGITLSVLSVCMLLICIIPAIMKAQFGTTMSASVGIIGGADGPTSVFIAGKLGTPWGLYIATAVIVIVTIIYFVRKRKKNFSNTERCI